MKTVLITGGTGLVGTRLTQLLSENGYKIIILSRKIIQSNSSQIEYKLWNVEQQTIDETAIASADYIIHLAGAGVAEKRWTNKRKKEIIESRIQSSSLLIKALNQTKNKVEAVISASAIGWYDLPIPNNNIQENLPAANNFLGRTCQLWEESIEPATSLGKRLVKLRIGIVLSSKGGALKEFLKPYSFRIAAIIGTGKQTISWIHIDDLCRMFIYAIENKNMHGVYNAVAPSPVSNAEMITSIAKEKSGFYIYLKIPAFILKLLLGEMSEEVLKSISVSCKKIQQSGFQFMYPDIKLALKNLFHHE